MLERLAVIIFKSVTTDSDAFLFFMVMHASSFLIRETKMICRFARFLPFGVFIETCNQRKNILDFNFYCSLVDTRSVSVFVLFLWRKPKISPEGV